MAQETRKAERHVPGVEKIDAPPEDIGWAILGLPQKRHVGTGGTGPTPRRTAGGW